MKSGTDIFTFIFTGLGKGASIKDARIKEGRGPFSLEIWRSHAYKNPKGSVSGEILRKYFMKAPRMARANAVEGYQVSSGQAAWCLK